MIKFFASIASLAICTTSVATETESIPVIIIDNDVTDACALGAVKGLKPKGDGYLSVRSGPGSQFAEKDRLFEGALFHVCDEKIADSGSWVGIVYPWNDPSTCGIYSPTNKVSVYKGPCKWGWINSKWVKIVAG